MYYSNWVSLVRNVNEHRSMMTLLWTAVKPGVTYLSREPEGFTMRPPQRARVTSWLRIPWVVTTRAWRKRTWTIIQVVAWYVRKPDFKEDFWFRKRIVLKSCSMMNFYENRRHNIAIVPEKTTPWLRTKHCEDSDNCIEKSNNHWAVTIAQMCCSRAISPLE